MIVLGDILLTAWIIIGLGLLGHGLWSIPRDLYLKWRDRRDAAPLRASLKRQTASVKARNARVSVKNIEDTF